MSTQGTQQALHYFQDVDRCIWGNSRIRLHGFSFSVKQFYAGIHFASSTINLKTVEMVQNSRKLYLGLLVLGGATPHSAVPFHTWYTSSITQLLAG
jgi:hypothetical protein